ncbi:MAG: SLC13 family permease, partial [Chloroflexi bacterium]|nr:SLC13 family permease [Chloroflexota bacterium]
PTVETVIKANDVLIVQGEVDDAWRIVNIWKLEIQPVLTTDDQYLVNREKGIAEVVLPPRSALEGKSTVDAEFNALYKLNVIGVSRPGVEGMLSTQSTPLRSGDSLLVQGDWHDIVRLRRNQRDFVVMGEADTAQGALNTSKAPTALIIMLGMLVLLITGTASLAAASLLAAIAMILTGCLSMDQAYQSIDWKSIVLLAGMLPLSIALEKVGLISLIAGGLTDFLGTASPLVIMGGLYLFTAVFTQVLSNTATTALVAPLGLAMALQLGYAPQAFLMTIAIAASMAFATPVASPTNTLVMGAGGYRFGDYVKIGIPMILLMGIVTVIVLPLLWPLN